LEIIQKEKKDNNKLSNHRNLLSLLDKVQNGQILTESEENYIIASRILSDIVENGLNSILSNNDNHNNNKNNNNNNDSNELIINHENNLSKNIYISTDKEDKTIKNDIEDEYVNLKNNHITDHNNNGDVENNGDSNSYNKKHQINNSDEKDNCKDNNNINNDEDKDNMDPKSYEDSWRFIKNTLNNFPVKKKVNVRKKKSLKLKSELLKHNVLLDLLNKNDLKKGLFKHKNFQKSFTLNRQNFNNCDDLLFKKNMKRIKSSCSWDSEDEIETKIIDVNLEKKLQVLKNVSNLNKRTGDIKEKWKPDYRYDNINENIKLKLMDIETYKQNLKNNLEDTIVREISYTLNQHINSDINNKLSKMLFKLYREVDYELDIENFEKNAESVFPNPNLLNGKAKILQENKDYLISAYLDIYDDILNDIYNSGNSIFEFNEEIKGQSILKNFEMRMRKLRHVPYYKNGATKEIFIKKLETIKNMINHENTINNNNSINNTKYNYQESKEIYNYIHERDETTSNYDRLGLANQLYINNILLRDFCYKENLQYIETLSSDKETDPMNNTLNDNSSKNNESYTLSNQNSNIKTNLRIDKRNSKKYFKSPIGNLLRNSEIQNEFPQNINGRICDFNKELADESKRVGTNKRRTISYNLIDNELEDDDVNYNYKENLKKKKKKDYKLKKFSKYSETMNNGNDSKKNNNQNAFWESSKLFLVILVIFLIKKKY